jgi:hypothetical protein
MLPATFYIIDMDGTTLDSKGDWSEKSLLDENLRNLDLLEVIGTKPNKGKRRNVTFVFGVIYTGRDWQQTQAIKNLFAKHNICFNTIITRNWSPPNPMNENRFYQRYWGDKFNYALLLSELHTEVSKVEIWDDDTVLCEMARRCKINCVQFQECEKIREDRF